MQYELRRILLRLPPPPLHFLSALVTVILDFLWRSVESTVPYEALDTGIDLPALLIVIGGLALICFLVVLVIERFLSHSDWPLAIGKGMVMGGIGALPYQFLSVAVLAVIFLWWDLRLLRQLLE